MINNSSADLAKLGKSYLRSFLVSHKGTGGSFRELSEDRTGESRSFEKILIVVS